MFKLFKNINNDKINDSELWDLDVTLAEYILPRLKKFREMRRLSHPQEFTNVNEWNDVLDKMIYSFQSVCDNNGIFCSISDSKYENGDKGRYQEGMDLFAKYYSDLWD